ASEPEVRPRGSSAQSLVLNHRCVLQQILLAVLMLESFVCAQPDAIAVAFHFTTAVARAAAWAVPLVLRALRFRTQKSNVRQRTIPAVFTLKENGFTHVLQQSHRLRPLLRIVRILAKARAQFRQRTIRTEHEVMRPFRQVIYGPGVF